MALASLAVVIPVYNRESIVLETLESVLAQTVSPDRVIIIDDGSQDNSYQVIENWLFEHKLDKKQWILIKQENQGVSVARNSAREFLDEIDLVHFLDSDDLINNHFISHFKSEFSKFNSDNTVAISCLTEKYYLESEKKISRKTIIPLKEMNNSFKFLSVYLPSVGATVFTKKALDNAGWFVKGIKYAEDHLLWHIIAKEGRWRVIDKPLFMYRIFNFDNVSHGSVEPHLLSRLRCARILDQNLDNNKYTTYAKWKTWYSAARQLEKRERKIFARPYYKMALKYKPFSLKTVFHLLRCYM